MLNYDLPGDGTLAGFLQHLGDEIGDSAIELVIQKFGINVSSKLVIEFVLRYFASFASNLSLCVRIKRSQRSFAITVIKVIKIKKIFEMIIGPCAQNS